MVNELDLALNLPPPTHTYAHTHARTHEVTYYLSLNFSVVKLEHPNAGMCSGKGQAYGAADFYEGTEIALILPLTLTVSTKKN